MSIPIHSTFDLHISQSRLEWFTDRYLVQCVLTLCGKLENALDPMEIPAAAAVEVLQCLAFDIRSQKGQLQTQEMFVCIACYVHICHDANSGGAALCMLSNRTLLCQSRERSLICGEHRRIPAVKLQTIRSYGCLWLLVTPLENLVGLFSRMVHASCVEEEATPEHIRSWRVQGLYS